MAVEQLITELRVDMGRFRREMQEASNVVRQHARQSQQNMDRLGGSVDKVSGSFNFLRTAIIGVGLTALVRDAINASNQMKSFELTLKVATGSLQASQVAIAFVRAEANRLGVGLVPAIQSFTKLSNATRGTRLEGQATREIFTALTEATRVLGLSNEQYGRVLLAVSQIAAKGRIQAEELLQLAEAGVPIYAALGRTLGKTGIELQNMLQKGEVGLENLLPLAKQLQSELGAGVADAANTFQAATSRLTNSIFELTAAFGDFITQRPAIIEAINAIASSILDLAESISGTSPSVRLLTSQLKEIDELIAALETKEPLKFPFNLFGGSQNALQKELEALKQRRKEIEQQLEVAKIATRVRQEEVDAQEKARAATIKAIEAEQKARQGLSKEAERAAKKAMKAEQDHAEETIRLLREREEEQEASNERRLDDEHATMERFREIQERANQERLDNERDMMEAFLKIQQQGWDDIARAEERAREKQQREIERNIERFADRTQGFLVDAFEGEFDSILDAFKRLLIEMAAAAITNRIIVPVITQTLPGLFGATGTGAGGAQGISSLGSSLNTQPFGGIFTQTTPTGQTGQGGQVGQAAGSAFQGAALGYAGYSIGSSIGGVAGIGNTGSERLGRDVGAGVLGAAGFALFGPVGGAVGALVGSLVGGAIGTLFNKNPSFRIGQNTDLFVNMQGEIERARNLKPSFQFGQQGQLTEFVFPVGAEHLGGGLEIVQAIGKQLKAGLDAIGVPFQALGIELGGELLNDLNAATDEFEQFLGGIKFSGNNMKQKIEEFLNQDLPAEMERIFGEIIQKVQLSASIESQIKALEEAMMTPAQLFERRLDEIAVLQAQTFGAGIEELTRLAPLIQQAVGQAFQLSGDIGVLGTDLPGLQAEQQQLIQILEELNRTVSGLPSFQGLEHPMTFTRPTLAMVHQGETLLPAGGGGGDTYNLTITVPPGSNGQVIGQEIFATIRQIKQRERYRQTRNV